MYHVHPPTTIVRSEEPTDINPKIATSNILKHRSFQGFKIKPIADYLESRKPVLVNSDCHISLAAPEQSMQDYFYKNADADEVIFIHEGTGKVLTQYGELPFSYGDYIVIPRGTIYQIAFNTEANRLLIIESFGPIRFPKRYKSSEGQLMEHAPYCERDIRKPENLQTIDQLGEFTIYTKKKDYFILLLMARIHLMSLDGMAMNILIFLVFMISNLLRDECINHLLFIKHLMARILSFARLCHDYSITILKQFLRPITIAI